MTKLRWAQCVLLVTTLSASGCASTMQLTSGETNMCMNVVNHGYPEPGAPVIMKECDPWRNQQWSFAGTGQITGVGDFCLDVQGSQPVDGAKIIYTPCSGSPSQNWTARNGAIVGIGDKCLDIEGSRPTQGAPLIIAPCTDSPSQRWISHY